jgi:hypothetical protein
MFISQSENKSDRKKQHVANKLKKAILIGQKLEQLIDPLSQTIILQFKVFQL